jgi:signal transduction histidine kinase
MLETAESFRTQDIHDDPRFRGWWPKGHPNMRSFLGVPISTPEGVIGAVYLTDKVGADEFTGADRELIELLAAHAAIAVTNARLYEQSRELSILSERNRLALELHDAVSQKLFSLVLNAEAAATLAGPDSKAEEQLARVQALAQEAQDELRTLIFELRPPEVERDGLCGALRKHVGLLALRRPGVSLELDDELPGEPKRDAEVLRIAQEALANAIRHADAEHIRVQLHRQDGGLVLEVADDGAGFDPDAAELRSRRLGLTSLEERALRLRGQLAIDSAPGEGTRVRLEVPAG